MLKELFFLISLPSIFCVGIYFLPKLSGFKNLGFWEKIIINLAVSVGILTSVLILVGLSPVSFRFFSQLIYWLNLFGLILLFLFRKKTLLNYFRTLSIKFNKLFSGNLLDLLFISLIVVFIVKILLFLLLKPIVDADVINYYLPFARTFYLEDKIPLYNFYDHTPVFSPPPGMSVLYSFAYSVAHSVFSESFRFFPLPFILGTVGVLYLMAKDFFGERGAQLTTLIFLFLPVWDALGMAGIFYPDIIFLFLSSVVFYLFLKIFAKRENSLFSASIAGLILGAALLFKFQGIFLYYFLFLFGLRSLPVFGKKLNIILASLALSPFLIDKSKIGMGFFRQPSLPVFFILIIVLFWVLFIFLSQRKNRQDWYHLKLVVFIFLFSLPWGAIWFLRNFFVFGHPFSLITPERIFTWGILNQIFPQITTQPPLTEWTLFLIPSLASFWLLPKLFFIIGSFWRKRWILPLTLLVGWYVIWFFYLDATNDRHLLPIFPLVSLMIFGGIHLIGLKLFKGIKVYYFSLLVIILGALFSFSQSLFIWWNLGVATYGNDIFHQIVNQTTGAVLPPPILFLYRLLIVLNSQGELFLNRIPALSIISLFLSLLILLVATKSLFFIRFLIRFKKELVLAFCFFTLLPYMVTFYLVSDGNPIQFRQKEKEKVYNYWGLTGTVVPYLMKNTSPNEVVAYFGMPQVGLAYFSNLRVYNLLGEDLGVVFKPIFYEENPQVIYSFLRTRQINYFAVNQNTASREVMKKFKGLTKIPQLLEDKRYFEQLIFPDNNHQWALYEIKK